NVSYIAVPIFLMLLRWEESIKPFLADGLFLNNRVVCALKCASTVLPFTIYLLSSYFHTLQYGSPARSVIYSLGLCRPYVSFIVPKRLTQGMTVGVVKG